MKKDKVKVLLLEGVDESSVELFHASGYSNVERLTTALNEDELLEKLQDVSVLGVRSRTNVSQKVLDNAPTLMAIGTFCIGTDQINLKAATHNGIPVFNAPHSNTRSVAELVVGLTVMLMRKIFPKNHAAHQGEWLKTSDGSHEVRGKVMGIIGYGHIGSQVSILAESIGMRVYYYDIEAKLPLGNAQAVSSIEELLEKSDVVTLHVPDTPSTKYLMEKEYLEKMKKGSFLINASRGKVVDIEALKERMDAGYIKGAALDVFPEEPKDASTPFKSPLQGYSNVIMTPHIGGSTLEAQRNIGVEVCRKLINYLDRGSSEAAVNFPQINLPLHKNVHRILHIHHNTPGMLQKINKVIADENINVQSQYLLTNQDIGYVVFDIEKKISSTLEASLQSVEGTIRIRVLY